MSIRTKGEYAADNPVQKISVVGNGDNDPREGIQIILEHLQRYYIQIICRLIQYEYVRRTHEDLKQA